MLHVGLTTGCVEIVGGGLLPQELDNPNYMGEKME